MRRSAGGEVCAFDGSKWKILQADPMQATAMKSEGEFGVSRGPMEWKVVA